MLKIIGLDSSEKISFALSSPGNSLRHKMNNLSELDFTLNVTSLVDRPESIICNGVNYPVGWTGNPKAYHQIFGQVDHLVDVKQDYKGAQKKLYYLLKDCLCRVNGSGGANGFVLVKAFLELSKISQKLKQWDDAINAATLASNLDPYNNTANLAVMFLCSDHGDSFKGYRYSEEAVSLEPRNLSARKSLVALASKEELYCVAGQHLEVQRALEGLSQKPFEAQSYVKLAKVFIDFADYNVASEVLACGLKTLEGRELENLNVFISKTLGWDTKVASCAA